MKKYYLFTIIILITAAFSSSIAVSEQNSLKVAKNIFKQFSDSKDINDFSVSSIEIIKSDKNQNLFYIYHLDPIGFIIVSASNRSLPCLAFSFESHFSMEPTPVQEILGTYKREIIDQLDNPQPIKPKIQENWDMYLSADPSFPELRDVQPLLNCTFAQSGNWNNLVQQEVGANVPVGCVAVAMSQVMHYWGFPSSGEGQNSYSDCGSCSGPLSVNFALADYNFDNMPGGQANSESQKLLYHTGVSVNMDYAPDGSGAYVQGTYPSTEYALENYFKFSSDLYFMNKSTSNPSTFGNAIIDNLDAALPIIMQGFDDSYGGHAWNVDGYIGDDFNSFHCNFGWGGSSNGWYTLASMGGFPDSQGALFNVYPRTLTNPEALFEYSVDASTVYFTDLSSMINEYDLKYFHWNFGDGNMLTTETGTVDHSYELSGTYEVQLVVENMHGMVSDPYIESITVQAAMVGDLTQDGNIDVLDIVSMVSLVLSDQPAGSQLFIGDINTDGIINIQDIILLIGIALNGE